VWLQVVWRGRIRAHGGGPVHFDSPAAWPRSGIGQRNVAAYPNARITRAARASAWAATNHRHAGETQRPQGSLVGEDNVERHCRVHLLVRHGSWTLPGTRIDWRCGSVAGLRQTLDRHFSRPFLSTALASLGGTQPCETQPIKRAVIYRNPG
jgi:hypothetical protein